MYNAFCVDTGSTCIHELSLFVHMCNNVHTHVLCICMVQCELVCVICTVCPCPLQMKKKVQVLEECSIADKPWQLSGETSDRLRPENSLLQDHLDFDHTSQPGKL